MAITIRSVTTGTDNGTNATVSVTTSESPSATQSGDLVFFFYDNDFYALSAMGTPTATGSPTINAVTAATADDTASGSHIKAYWYVANTAGAQTISATETGTHDEDKGISVYVLAGADTTTPVDDASNTVQSTSSPTSVVTGVTPTTTNALLFCHLRTSRSASGGGSWTPPGSMTERYDVANFTTFTGATEQLSASGATGTRTFTPAASAPFVASAVAIKSASAAATIPPPPLRGPQVRDPGEAWWIQRDRRDANTVATAADSLPSPLDSAWQAGARYWHLYGDAADSAPRTWQSLQRQYVSDPNLLGPPPAAVTYVPTRTVPARDPGEVWWQQRPGRDPAMLGQPLLENELLGGADAARHAAAAAYVDRREIPQQRAYISDPSFYPTVAPTDPLAVAWGAGGPLWWLYNTAAAQVDRREVPQQRRYVSDPALLASALLEGPLLGGADDLRRHWLVAAYGPRWALFLQRAALDQAAFSLADPLLVGGGVGGDSWRRYATPVTHDDRRETAWQPPRWVIYTTPKPVTVPGTLSVSTASPSLTPATASPRLTPTTSGGDA